MKHVEVEASSKIDPLVDLALCGWWSSGSSAKQFVERAI